MPCPAATDRSGKCCGSASAMASRLAQELYSHRPACTTAEFGGFRHHQPRSPSSASVLLRCGSCHQCLRCSTGRRRKPLQVLVVGSFNRPMGPSVLQQEFVSPMLHVKECALTRNWACRPTEVFRATLLIMVCFLVPVHFLTTAASFFASLQPWSSWGSQE